MTRKIRHSDSHAIKKITFIEETENIHLVPKDAGENAATEVAVATRVARTFIVTRIVGVVCFRSLIFWY